MSHMNAALTPRVRLRLARLIVDQGWPVARAAERYDVSWPTAKRWADRYRQLGEGGMLDRSSRPHRSPNRTPRPVVRAIVKLRWKQRLGPVAIADRVGVSASTVHAVLARCRLNRLSHLDRVTGEPVRRYEHPHPGAMLHVRLTTDVKKLGNIPDGGGWRYVGRAQGLKNRAATPEKEKNAWHGKKMGTAFVHTVVDWGAPPACGGLLTRGLRRDPRQRDRGHRLHRPTQRGVLVHRTRGHCRTRAVRQRQLLPQPPVARHLPRARRHA